MSCLEKIDERSAPALNSALNIFHVPPTNVSNEEAFFREVLPLNTIAQDTTSSAPFLFRLFNDTLWADLSHVYLYLDVTIQKQEATTGGWTNVVGADANSKIGGIQLLGQTFVQQLRVHIGTTEVYDSGPLYAYRAYISNELSHSQRMKKTFLATAGYYPSTEHDTDGDKGFMARCELFKNGRSAQFYSRLNFDLGNQERYMLNNVDLLFTVYRGKDAFVLQNLKPNDGTRYRLFLHDVRLYVKMHNIQPSLNMAVFNELKRQTAKYALRRTEVRSHFLTEGRTEVVHNVFTTQVPRRLTIALVANKAFNGHMKLSPFNFQPFALRELAVHANGKIYPHVAYDLDFKTRRAHRAYVDLWEALGSAGGGVEQGPDLTLAQWYDGWTFFTVPMTSTLDDWTVAALSSFVLAQRQCI